MYNLLQEYRLDDNENQCRTADLYKDRYVFGASDLSTSNQCTPDETVTAMDISTSFKSTLQLLKFVFLLGILTVQGAEKASATSNIMDNLQSANFFGDLSDISTGFASVRKISLQLLQFATRIKLLSN